MPKGDCEFNPSWLKYENWKAWIARGNDKYHAKCILFSTQIDISGGATSDLRSHARGKKHK